MNFSTLRDLLALEVDGDDAFLGHSPNYPWGRVYGGQAVAQALWAAGQTVDPRFRPHSLHAYFIRGGQIDRPIRYEVDRIRDGRSFVTRRVVGTQYDPKRGRRAIMNLSASFQVEEDEAEAMIAVLPDVPMPGTFESAYGDPEWSSIFERQVFPHGEPGRALSWTRIAERLDPDDHLLRASVVAYLSDDVPTESVIYAHPDFKREVDLFEQFMTTSLDHAVWFHDLAGSHEWMLHDFNCDALRGGRGHTNGRIFTQGGGHVATVSQEVLLRKLRPNH